MTFTPTGGDGAPIRNSARQLTVDAARAWSLDVVAALARGEDPTPTRKATVPTFAALAAEHLEAYTKVAAPNSITVRTRGCVDACSLLGPIPVDRLDVADAVRLRDAWADRPGKRVQAWIAAKEAAAVAADRGHLKVNPFTLVKAPARPAPRERYPDLDQLAAIDRAAEALGAPVPTCSGF